MSAEHAEQVVGDDEITNPVARAWAMRVHERQTFRDIAAELGIGVATAVRYVERGQKAWDFAFGGEAAERDRDLAAADEWLAKLHAAADTGELAVDAASREARGWLAWRASTIGYSAPRKSAITIEPERPKPVPDMALLEELKRAKEHAQRMAELEEEDGLTP